MGDVIQAADGHFYGTTHTGGPAGFGTIFRATSAGFVTTVHAFSGVGGRHPMGGLVQGADGALYGTTFGAKYLQEYASAGVAHSTVFRLTSGGALTTLHAFGYVEGVSPFAGLVVGTDGHMYGTTTGFGVEGRRSVFKIAIDGGFAVLHSAGREFSGCDYNCRMRPISAPMQASDGNVYWMLSPKARDADPLGYAMSVTPEGAARVQHYFPGWIDVRGALIQAADKNLYGVGQIGGNPFYVNGDTLFRFRTGVAAPSPILTPSPGRSIRLSWTAVPGAMHYVVRRGTTPGALGSLGVVTTTSVDDTGVAPGQRYYYSVAAVNAFGEGLASYVLSGVAGRAVSGDLDGDARSDVTTYRPSTGQWTIRTSSSGYQGATTLGFGGPGDLPLTGDFDGDGQQDLATYRPSIGYWFIRTAATGFAPGGERAYRWGAEGDVPLAADFDGDMRTDLTVYRPSERRWYIWRSTAGLAVHEWGAPGDRPVVADFDGDGQTELTVYRPSTGEWFTTLSSAGYVLTGGQIQKWGDPGDVPVAADYDGDGRTDLAVYRPSEGLWFVWGSATLAYGSWQVYRWGGAGLDRPIVQDFDGDGRADLATYRPTTGEWFVTYSSTDFTTFDVFQGAPNDVPVP